MSSNVTYLNESYAHEAYAPVPEIRPTFRRRIAHTIPHLIRMAGIPVLRVDLRIDLNITIHRSSD